MLVYLGVGTGASDRIDLTDNSNYLLLDFVVEDAPEPGFQQITVGLLINFGSKSLTFRRIVL